MKWSDYILLQMDEIRRHKWIESEKAGADVGRDAALDWVDNHAATFRAYITQELGEKIETEEPQST